MRPQEITFAYMHSGGRGPLVYGADYRCATTSRWRRPPSTNEIRLSDLEPKFICQNCGERGADGEARF